MKDVYNELISALKRTNFTDNFSSEIADFLSTGISTDISAAYFNEVLEDRLLKVKKAIQQTLINCKS